MSYNYFRSRARQRRRLPPTVTNPASITERKIRSTKDLKEEIIDQLQAQSLQNAVPYVPGFVVTPVINIEL